MLRNRKRADSPGGEPIELAALADGSLASERRAPLAALVAASPELAARLAEQERVITLVHGVSATVGAPSGLRARIDAERRPRRHLRRQSFRIGTGLAAAAATALALFFALPGGAGGPSVAAAAQLSARTATGAAPKPQSPQSKQLEPPVGDVAFPNWEQPFGWRAAGVRTDMLDGRRTATVFYRKAGHRLGYTIVDGPALRVPRGAALVERDGTELHSFVLHGRFVVTWRSGGRTCVLYGPAVGREVLLKLAVWSGGGPVSY